jgi:protein SCO1/2
MRPRNLLIAALAVFAIAFGGWTSYRLASPPAEPTTAMLLPTPEPLPEFSLVDRHGNAVGPAVFEGQWDLVFFGFTHCPDICPLTLQTLADARRRLADAGREPLPRIVFVSVDPDRDTPEKLGEYVDHFGDGILALTGRLEELRKLTGELGIYFQKVPSEGGDYTVDHSAAVLVVNPRGDFSALFGSSHSADSYVHDLPIIMSRR